MPYRLLAVAVLPVNVLSLEEELRQMPELVLPVAVLPEMVLPLLEERR